MKVLFEDILRSTQKGLYSKIAKMFENSAVCSKNNYILIKGTAPILLVAHMDTVHREPVREICKSRKGTVLMSPQGIGGDDRCGVYALLTIYEQSSIKPWLLFTCDEETGGIGARVFADDHAKGKMPDELSELKLIIEIDRKGKNDAVYYDCENPDFEKYIASKGFKTKFGSFSDISVVAPAIGIAAVNLSSGYYNAHTLHEYIDTMELNATIQKVAEIVSEVSEPDFPQYEYIEAFGYMSYHRRDPYCCYGFDYDYDYEEYLKDVPDEYKEDYLDLLEIYYPEELENMRAEGGDNVIHDLWEYEFMGEETSSKSSLHDLTDKEFSEMEKTKVKGR